MLTIPVVPKEARSNCSSCHEDIWPITAGKYIKLYWWSLLLLTNLTNSSSLQNGKTQISKIN